MREVRERAIPLSRLARFLSAERSTYLNENATRMRKVLAGRTVWTVNATAQGGGVAELLHALVPYALGTGIDVRWLVLTGDPRFFEVTKRIHNMVHGSEGDGGGLNTSDLAYYNAILAENLVGWSDLVEPGDVVILHDPQTAGMVSPLKARGARVVWRCHIGSETPSDNSDRAWAFLRPLVESADAFVFSRKELAPPWLRRNNERLRIISPSLDPLSPKNTPMKRRDVDAVLRQVGLVAGTRPTRAPRFVRRDETTGLVRAHRRLLLDEDGPLPDGSRLVVQVSRWDRLKDMAGVLVAFADNLDAFDDAHLLLVGPEAIGVTDDPEGRHVLDEVRILRASLAPTQRERTHLCCLPMDDVDENAYVVNAIQRRATLVVQKSLAEGFGLTVTEPMWKARPVLASALGGIADQIEDGVSGVLLNDPTDLRRFAALAAELLGDDERQSRLGRAAHRRVADRYLSDRQLLQAGELLEAVIQ